MKNNIYKQILSYLSILLFLPFLAISQPTEEEIQQSIDDGLAWLVNQQDPTDGWWEGYYSYYAGSKHAGTGLALYKLCERAYEMGYDSPFNEDYEYHQNVIDGFEWVFDQLQLISINTEDHTAFATGTVDDPDVNSNGTGICSLSNTSMETYATGVLLTAIAASGTPDMIVNVPSSVVDGWTFGDVAQDMVDFLAWAQVESTDGSGNPKEGGWDYFNVDDGTNGSTWKGDQSNSGYAVLGLAEAQDFGATIPEWVKTELSAWIDYVQDDVDDPAEPNDGGSWYSYPGDYIGINTLKTGNLLSEMALVGDMPDDQRVLDAINYLQVHWTDASGANAPPGWNGDPAQYQAMFCLMKGLVFMGIDYIDGADWFEEFATVILAQQELTDPLSPNYGSWQASSGRGTPVTITLWALLTLEKIAPNVPPEALCHNVELTAGVNCEATAAAVDFDDGSYDPNDDEITLSISPEGPYPLGTTVVTLIVTDENGASDECTATVTVVDESAPVITTVAGPLTMWPPNHKYETFGLGDLVTSVSDDCNSGLTIDDVYITDVSSDEPEDTNGNGDGKTIDDMVIADDCMSVDLRKERQGNGNGRVYTIYLALDDGNGNTAETSVEVHIEHNPGNLAIDDGAVYWEAGNCSTKEAFASSKVTSNTVMQNYPNPFADHTKIDFSVGNADHTVVKVINFQGTEVAVLYNGFAEAGTKYTLEFKAEHIPAGIYFVYLQNGKSITVKKMIKSR